MSKTITVVVTLDDDLELVEDVEVEVSDVEDELEFDPFGEDESEEDEDEFEEDVCSECGQLLF